MENLSQNTAGVLILVFLTFNFGVSLLEKIFDWKRSINYFDKTFHKTRLKNFIKPLVAIMTFFEFLNFLILSAGLYLLIASGEKTIALLACSIASFTSLYILGGQRVAKKYSATNSLTIYFVIAVFGVFLFL